MHSKAYKCIELFLLFVALPVSFTLSYSLWLKVMLTVLGVGYVGYLFKKTTSFEIRLPKPRLWKSFLKSMSILFGCIIILSSTYVYIKAPEALFYIVMYKPILWISILFVYTFLSVVPQEFIYRTFFFNRYQTIFGSTRVLIFCNAILFSLAHIFFQNFLVQLLTFIGGLLFAYTYHKTKSTLLVSIEHALYGNWLFTVGMGEMLGFPGMP